MIRQRFPSQNIYNVRRVRKVRKLTEFGFKNPFSGDSSYQTELEVMRMENDSMEIPVEKTVLLSDGSHKGVITAVENVKEPYKYTEIYIKEDETETIIRCGVPTKVTNMSSLGMIMENFGVNLEQEERVNPRKVLVDKRCQFVTVTEKGERGTFAKVQPQSVRPE